jgi:hypothetical protein
MNRDIMVACMFEENHMLMISILEQCRKRLIELSGGTVRAEEIISDLFKLANEHALNCQVVFVACLNIDVQLKSLLIEGFSKYKLCPLPARKATLFFTYLEQNIILPWLMDERVSNEQLIRNVKNYYLLS